MAKRGPKEGSTNRPNPDKSPNPHGGSKGGKPARATPMVNVCNCGYYGGDHAPTCPHHPDNK